MKDSIIKKTTGMVADCIDNLTVEYSRLGLQLRKQLSKILINKGGPWASLAFSFEEGESKKVMLASFRAMDGEYKRFSYFNIKSREEAIKICNFLKEQFNLEEGNV